MVIHWPGKGCNSPESSLFIVARITAWTTNMSLRWILCCFACFPGGIFRIGFPWHATRWCFRRWWWRFILWVCKKMHAYLSKFLWLFGFRWKLWKSTQQQNDNSRIYVILANTSLWPIFSLISPGRYFIVWLGAKCVVFCNGYVKC